MRADQEAPRDVEIAIIDEAAILGHEAVPMRSVPAGYPVPREAWPLVMDGVQVVVEKQEPEDRSVLDDRRALVDVALGAMLREGAHEHQGRARIDEGDEVDPQI